MQFAHFEFDPEADRLGEGPLSEVYRAVDTKLGRRVALKILRPHAEIDPAADQRFHREAKHASRVTHPNIAVVYEYDQAEGTAYIAMEYLQGRTLDKVLKDQTLGYEECLRIAMQITGALAAVHKHGLIHRDLKPGNVMLLDDGSVKLLDFGIARATNESSITQHGMLVGTVLYMAPEQVRGDELDLRSDVFSLGSVLYHTMTSALPFPGKSFPEVCMAILDGNPRRPSLVRSGFPQRLEDFILKCLAPEPDDRYADANRANGELLSIADQLLHGTRAVPSRIEGRLVIPPIACAEDGTGRCSVIAGGLRKDLAKQLQRIKGLSIDLVEDLAAADGFDFLLRAALEVEPPDGRLALSVEHYSSRNGRSALLEEWADAVASSDANEWALQEELVRGAARIVRRRLTEVSLKPGVYARRNEEKARALAQRAHETALKGTSRHLMSAISSYRHAIEADPYCALAFAGLSEATVRKYLYWDGDPAFLEESRQLADKALAIDPECAEAHTSLGFGCQLSGRTTEAQREYRVAIQLDNDEWLAHRLLGSLLAREGNFKNAAPILQRATILEPSHIASYDYLYNVLQRLDRYEESLEVADKGISAAKAHLREHPDSQEARTHMALLLARMGSHDEARERIREALELAPKDGYTSFLSACVYAITGDFEEAVDQLVRARDRGYFLQAELLSNHDLDVLRGLPEFLELAS